MAADFADDVVDTSEVVSGLVESSFRFFFAFLKTDNPCCFLKEKTEFIRCRLNNFFHLALFDDGNTSGAHACVIKNFTDVFKAAFAVVDFVFTLTGAVKLSGYCYFGESAPFCRNTFRQVTDSE